MKLHLIIFSIFGGMKRTMFFYCWPLSITAIFLLSLPSFSQCPAGLDLSNTNLIVNGDFSAGNSDFTSGYEYCNTSGCLTPSGTYSVGPDASFYNSNWEGSDHTTGSGNFLIVNGSEVPDSAFWCQVVPVDPNSFYEISYWATSTALSSPAQIQLYINTFPFFPQFFVPSATNTWTQFSQIWQSGLNTSINFCLKDLNDHLNGNDFGIDDISIRKCECALTIEAGDGGSICLGDSLQLNGSGASSYYWTPTNTLSCFTCQNPVASPQTTTTYTVSALGPGGCTALDSLVVVVWPTLDLQAGPDTSICPGASVQVSASGAVSYQWFPATGLSAANIPDPVATPEASITYFLSAVDEHGCDQSDTFHINVFPPPETPVASPDTSICVGQAVLLNVNMDGTITWSPPDALSCTDCKSPVTSTDKTITYTVSVIDINGCFAGTDSVTIEVSPACSVIELPSAFSPNNDGKNDLFKVVGSGIVSFHFTLYNRWGELIFTTNDSALGWDGTWQGEKQDIGVYVWHLVADLLDGTHVVRNGNVTLVR